MSLAADGFVVLDAVLGGAELTAIRAGIDTLHAQAKSDPLFRTGGTLHLDGLLDIGAPFDCAWRNDRVVAEVTALVGRNYRVSRAHMRSPLPGEGAQALHADFHKLPPDGGSYLATTIVAIDDFTLENGATRVVPGSHRQLRMNVPKGSDAIFPGERVVTMSAGSALVFSGHLWHSGTRNRSNGRRDALQIIFTREDMPQYGK